MYVKHVLCGLTPGDGSASSSAYGDDSAAETRQLYRPLHFHSPLLLLDIRDCGSHICPAGKSACACFAFSDICEVSFSIWTEFIIGTMP